jgi:primosomal protein N' (replication factor Y)
MRAEMRLGQLVWVPFHGRHLQGVVAGFDDSSPVEKTLDIEEIVDPQPILSPIHLELARWISEYYLAPLHLVILAMLPPGVTQSVEVVISAVPNVEAATVSKAQAELLSLLRAKGPLTLRQVARLSKRADARAVVSQLVSHGWADKRTEVRPPRAKPKLAAVVRLRPGLTPDDLPSRSSKRRQALAYLLERRKAGDEWLPLADAADEAGVSAADLRALAAKGLAELGQRQVWRDPLAGQSFVPVIPPRLTPEQEAAWQVIAQDLDHPAGRPFLLHGVTGSGKTEIYLRAVQHVLAQGRGAIVLVPEIALTPQTIRRFGARFPTTIAVMHSHLSPGERYDQWRRLRAGELRLVVGSRSAIFAPVRDLGLIVLDEEHEWSYKQDKTPHYHAREVALHLSELAGATCILGSATPDLESAYRAERGEYVRLSLPQRIMGHRHILEEQAAQAQHVSAPGALLQDTGAHYHTAEPGFEEAMYAELPPVEVVDMRAELRAGNRSIFSQSLQRAMEIALAAKEQIILFINRRGEATFVMCRDCGHVLKCPRCDLPLTYHADVDDLICHHCSYKTFVPPQCPSCWSGRIKFFGVGTQRVEELVREAYPQARVVRWDLDTTGGKLDHERILDRFINGEADIMVGTQMIAKGLDLPLVTLVGVLAADTAINLPDFRAGERTFQLLTQVAGRAGRSILGGRVIIQTYTPHHPAIQAASKHDYAAFYAREIAFRRERWYPPLSRLIQLIYTDTNAQSAQREAERLHRVLTLKIARQGLPDIGLVGPVPAFFSKLRGRWRWQILIRGTDPMALLRDMRLPLGWRVDVDPVSLL